MFDIFAKLLSSIASFLFPLFASYKALKTSDPAQLTPWLMYWVVLACTLLVESWTEWLLVWMPLYAYIRLFFLLYLVLPQTQGARIIYTTYIHPYLEDNESQIEDFIATAHDKLKAAGLAYIKRAFEIVRTQVLGFPPSESSSQQQQQRTASEIPASLRPRSYTQSLLDRFQLPQARWSGNAGSAGQDFYNFLSNAVATAAGSGSGAGGSARQEDKTAGGNTSGTLVPPSIRDNADKMSFLAAQRERLHLVLSALDREAAQLRSSATGYAPVSASLSASQDINLDSIQPLSGRSGLSKSRSELDFEKIEAESGAEDNVDPAQDGESARATPSAAATMGSWIPWGW
ncbi:HVA22 family TB2/DP1 protein, partial [Coniella lustricola]